MILARWPTVNPIPKFGWYISRASFPSTYPLNFCSVLNSNFSSTALNCHFTKNKNSNQSAQGFSVLPSDIPWETGSLWSTMAMYMFNLHIPLGYGGLSIVAYIMHQPVLDPQIQAVSLLLVEFLELIGTLLLLRSIIKPEHNLSSIFKVNKFLKERNWLLASAIGFGVLILLVFITSILADRLYETKAVNNPALKGMLESSDKSKVACVLVYCIIAPVLEETVYRGLLLTSLASEMNWQRAVVISTAIFSAAHFSGENFVQLCIIGCVLGCSYCWTGNLRSSILIHTLYNALTLMVTSLS